MMYRGSTWGKAQYAYRFNAKPENDQIKLDMDDEIQEPARGEELEIDGNGGG
jgi:hypothetical protein